jgi:protoporphyrinogen/coproporphyrinogen III oxidase
MVMTKNIVIIGGGISGLSLLYFLKRKYAARNDIKITLLEKSGRPGGNIQTQEEKGCFFECGPNGFLAQEPALLDLVSELGLMPDLITADAGAKKRYVLIDQVLQEVPSGPLGLFGFKPMTLGEQLRVFAEPFIAKSRVPNEAVYDFAKRRFGVQAARYFMDPMVSGIYAGDSEFLSIEAAFPRIYQLEQRYGSVIRGMLASGGKTKFRSEMKSFRYGMGQLVNALVDRTRESIRLNEPVREIIRANAYYLVVTDQDKYPADELYMCTPAYAAGALIDGLHRDMAQALKSIDYAPLAVVGLVFERSAFNKAPEGFGYLVPSIEENPVLGVLIESNVFAGRAAPSQVLLRVMIGGSRNPECARKSTDELTTMALIEIGLRYGVTAQPKTRFCVSYQHAIPQYETAYIALKSRIQKGLITLPHLHLLANYLNGVAVNDCVRNAKETAANIEI